MLTGSFTFVAMTYNLWGDAHLEQREPAIRDLFATRPPDLLATQELRPRSRAVVDEMLPGHARVHDDFPGWGTQSNLWWREELFELVEYGTRDVGILAEHAELFWVRLRPRTAGAEPLVFSTAHLTWPGHPPGAGRRPQPARRPGRAGGRGARRDRRRRGLPVHGGHQRHRSAAVGARQRRLPRLVHRARPHLAGHPPRLADAVGRRARDTAFTADVTVEGHRLDLLPWPRGHQGQRGRRLLLRRERAVGPQARRGDLHPVARRGCSQNEMKERGNDLTIPGHGLSRRSRPGARPRGLRRLRRHR
ncbi:hypothetical protein [Nonomuraea salmonea]|uniref:hypothetical protein n=1 Tax=Nonomuraea salmonea TaxID=46181 RepID=UPI0031F16EE0